MKVWQKAGIGVVAAALAGGIVWYSVNQANKDVVTVQTAKVGPEHLTTIVTSSGQVTPKTYSNILALGIGQITEIRVKEGDQVKRGDILLQIDSIQPKADAEAQKDSMNSAQAGLESAQLACVSATADVKTAQALLANDQISWDLGQKLFKDGLITKMDFDTRKTVYDGQVSAVASAQAKVPQCKAQIEQARHTMEQSKATLVHMTDVLNKTTYRAPIDGIVTYIGVRKGENIVPGVQNSDR